MSYEKRPVDTSLLICDLCGEPIPESTYHGGADHRGRVTREPGTTPGGASTGRGQVLFGWIAGRVSNRTRHGRLTWPPSSWERTKSWKERPETVHYDFHGECILRLVEANLHAGGDRG